MALQNQTDPQWAAGQLTEAITRHVSPTSAVEVTGVTIPRSNGMSGETVLFDATWDGDQHALVARVQPSGPAVFPRYDLQLEFDVMRAVGEHSSVPVPRMLFSEPDAALLGAPFIVMERVSGRVPSDDPPHTTEGWVLRLTPERQATLYENALSQVAAIHAVDIDAAGLAKLRDHPEAGFDGQLRFWENTFAWAANGESNPTVEQALAWIREHRPTSSGSEVLNWGDARIGNIIFDDQLRAAAVLDWEMLSVSPRELDLGWWQFLQRYYTEGIGAPPLPGFPTAQQTLARYSELAGVAVDHGLVAFYEVFAATRLSILMHRAGNMMVEAGLLPPGAPMRISNPASQTLARLLDLPAPEGETQSFVGNR
ncbi:phosphotransferase family protein [Mycolicibacterium pulveris]|uniref:Putative phosphotransferase n=1 Tax=Mycolicibacterium pulveris TaxID=36813 RepID=A0A7I7UIV2_MYCPV|nr:phosphotransferase family protein [Mycolicibacterium pulveris]MCV6979370.1 phosphotransferase family protein [Mycolicibacterium pulveris]BBY81187.1 putative phosphotransferase [Mycolicibacterium pulveris]